MVENEPTDEIVDRRMQVYGDPVLTYIRIAQVWSGILGHTVRPVEVPLMMAGMKLVRAQLTPDYSDNIDDVDGYIDIARSIVGDQMIHARSVQDYLDKKYPSEIEIDFNQVAYATEIYGHPSQTVEDQIDLVRQDIQAGHPQLPLNPISRWFSGD